MADSAIIIGDEDVIPALRRMELERERLIEAITWADGERALCTANDAKGFDLIMMNARLGRALRDQFAGDRWQADETDNQPGIFNPHLKLRVTPCNFDENAGNPLADPANLREKGTASNSKTLCNGTLWIPGLEPKEEDQGDECQTYILGTHLDDNNVLRAELSRPIIFAFGRFVRFKPRIILLDGTREVETRDKRDRAPTDDIDITIRRK